MTNQSMVPRNQKGKERIHKTSVGQGKHKIDLTAVCIGNDVVLVISGGEEPHIGAVAISIPRPSSKNHSALSSTSSVFTLLGHKDDAVARPASEIVSQSLNKVAVVTAGIHVKDANKIDIQKLVANSRKGVKEIIKALRN